MIPITVFAGQKVALFGLGGSGMSTARALKAGGAIIAACDDDAGKMTAAAAEGIGTADLRSADWAGFAAFILSPGVPLTHKNGVAEPHWTVALAQAAGVEVIGDVELLCRQRRQDAPAAPLVAITGTNGKSTTTALTAHVLRFARRDTHMGGNIGVPVTDLAPPVAGRTYVVECSSFQIDLAPTLDATVGVQLNITPDHLDRHGSIENYAGIKERLVAGVEANGTAVIGVDDAYSAAMADRIEAAGKKVVRISVDRVLANGIYRDGSRLMLATNGKARMVADLTGIGALKGNHNAQNAAAVVATALALGVAEDVIQAGLASFPGLAHRMERIGTAGRVLFVNDSKATNADAADKALSSYDNIYWIAGGVPKAGGIEPLRDYFPMLRKAYLIGEAAAEFAATIGNACPHTISGTLDAAIDAAFADAAASGDAEPVVLLSPACASYDQYRNFEIRGDAFRAKVRTLASFRGVGEAG